ncbi:tRNA (adenosine(37)-N6)-threonylcarbamoyltransferase complex transferase subunit TsaD [Candidatus Mycoplasma haematobovis]|uniref:tRNA (adenosine(37)-N6)-threonylcarbamoyltransferase complex transferase subunit TsaD n=1 Tax=Candidatus Mycoplasma haematobovis TaxID=432608 RepID=UPI000B181CBB|nr:tRNA (adenosine(37)-N6)-threonylcarbamoyltransferase complex transferase subunit TsaD [Candidatus Mycoplasma haematobovis]
MLILGIETSCDDTSLAIVQNHKLIDVLTISSSKLQNKWGGVVPEIASRNHEEHILPLLLELLNKNNLSINDITHIAYTDHPGLIGCLLVGKIFAKTLSFLLNKPLIPINHVYGHIFSVGLTNKLIFPHLALVVSGKTTSLFYVKSYSEIITLDSATDNALGEIYDKVARRLGLDYPGGPIIDSLFDNELKVKPLLKQKSNPAKLFSYGGILSATLRLCETESNKEYIATVFQSWVINELINKLKYWIEKTNTNCITVSGGVAANKYLRSRLNELKAPTLLVDLNYAGDNAAMIAYYASFLI